MKLFFNPPTFQGDPLQIGASDAIVHQQRFK